MVMLIMYITTSAHKHPCSQVSSYHHAITLWFLCLGCLIQASGKVARVKKGAKHEPKARLILQAFPNLNNIPKCLDQANLTQIP